MTSEHSGGTGRNLAGWVAVLSCLVAAAAPAAEDVSIEAVRGDEAVEVHCQATVSAPLELIWNTLTDYNRLSEFIPGMRSSRILEIHGTTTIVEQSGEARFLFLSFPIEVTVASTERRPHGLDVKLLKGNLRKLHGGYRIEPLEGGRMVLQWRGRIAPQAYLPPLVGEILMRAIIGDQFLGMVREIERREALRREKEAVR